MALDDIAVGIDGGNGTVEGSDSLQPVGKPLTEGGVPGYHLESGIPLGFVFSQGGTGLLAGIKGSGLADDLSGFRVHAEMLCDVVLLPLVVKGDVAFDRMPGHSRPPML